MEIVTNNTWVKVYANTDNTPIAKFEDEAKAIEYAKDYKSQNKNAPIEIVVETRKIVRF